MASIASRALKRLRQTGGSAGDLVSGARSWLDRNAPSLESAVETSARFIAGPALDPLSRAMGKPTERERIQQLRREQGRLGVALSPLTDIRSVGENIAEEPILYGANRALGIEGGGASPFSGRQREATKRAIGEIDNPAGRIAGAGALGALDFATDPTSYIAGLGFVGRGVGLAGAAARAAEFGALSGLGGQTAEELGAPRIIGEFAGPLGPSIARRSLRVLRQRVAAPGGGEIVSMPEQQLADLAAQVRARGGLSKPPPTFREETSALAEEARTLSEEGRGIGRLRSLYSEKGERGAIDEATAIRLGATAAGGAVGAATGDSMEEKIRNGLLGAAAGYVGGTVAKGQLYRTPPRNIAALATDLDERLADITTYGTLLRDRPAADTPLRLIGDMRRMERAGGRAGGLVNGSTNLLVERVEQALRDGEIMPTAEGVAAMARFGAATKPLLTLKRTQRLAPGVEVERHVLPKALRERWARGTPAEFLLDEWVDRATGVPHFTVSPSAAPEAVAALTTLRTYWDKVLAAEASLGVSHKSVVGNYLPRAWNKVGATVARGFGRKPGSRKPFEHERTLLSVTEGLEKGYLPAWGSVGDLFEYRLNAGVRAMAEKAVLDTMKNAEWVSWATKAPGENYERLTIPTLQRFLPYLDHKGAQVILDELEAGALTKPQALSALKEEAELAVRSPWLRADVADELSGAMGAAFGESALEHQGWWRALSNVVTEMKGVRLAADVAMVGRETLPLAALQVTTGGTLNTLNPVAWGRAGSAMWRAFETAVTWGGVDEALRDPSRQRWVYRLGLGGRGTDNLILGYGTGKAGLARVKPLGAFENWQFNEFIPMAQVETAEHLYHTLSTQRAFRDMDPVALEDLVAGLVNRATGHMDLVALGHHPVVQSLERTGLLSAGWTHGILGLVTGAFKGGPEGLAYRRFWLGTAAAAVGINAALAVALTMDASPEHLKELLDPRGQDSLTNPNGRGFNKIELPDGTRMDLWGPLTPVLRAALTAPATGGKEYTAERERGKGMVEAAWLGIKRGAVGGGEGRAGIETIYKWFEGRRSMPVGMALDLRANRDYRQRMIVTGDTSEAQWLDRLKYFAGQLTPGVGEVGLSTEQSPTPELVFGREQALTRGVGSFLGFNVSTPARDPDALKGKVEQFLATQGVHGGLDPISKLKRSTDIDPRDKQRFLADNPDVTDYVREKRKEAAKALGVPHGRDAVRLFSSRSADLEGVRNAAIRNAGAQYQQNQISGDDYRETVSEAWDVYIGGRTALARSILGVETLDEAFRAQKRVYGNRTNMNEHDLLMEQWYSIRPVDGSRAAREAAADERQRFVANLPPQQRVDFLERRRNRAKEIGGEVYAQYFDAQQAYGELAQIAPYRGLEATQSRRVQALLDRARDRQQMQQGLKLRQAVLLDPRATVEDKAWAVRTLGGKLSNPQRKVYRAQHAQQLGAFYGSLLRDEVEEIAG